MGLFVGYFCVLSQNKIHLSDPILALPPVLYIPGSPHCDMLSHLEHWLSGLGNLENGVSELA